MKVIKVKIKDNPYNVYIGHNLAKAIRLYLKSSHVGNFAIVITSQDIYSLYKDKIADIFKGHAYRLVKVAQGESAKSALWLFRVINALLGCDRLNRRPYVVCFGGGTIGDLGGFAASMYKRGIPYIQIPTTLLSQIDASIGGKTAINLKEAKNILGTFYQPKAVFIDPTFLHTLPQRQIKEGIAEAVKYGVIKDEALFRFIKNNFKGIKSLKISYILKLIERCVQIKAKIVADDEKEKKGIRTILNFGHTFAHALEASSRYKKISHGQAVSLGMLYAAHLSLILGKCSSSAVSSIKEILDVYGLPTAIKSNYTTIYKSMCYDKKFIRGTIRMVLLKDIGKVLIVADILPEKIRESLKTFTDSVP